MARTGGGPPAGSSGGADRRKALRADQGGVHEIFAAVRDNRQVAAVERRQGGYEGTLRKEQQTAKPRYWWRPEVSVNQHTDEGPWELSLWTVFAFPMKDQDNYTPKSPRLCPHCGKELPEVHNG